MNVKYFVFVVSISISLHVKNCGAEIIEVTTSDDMGICTVKLDQCQLKGKYFTESPTSEPGGIVYLKGLQGEPGSQGPKGRPGEKGEIGPQGPMGKRGDTGKKGIEGNQGEDGPDGNVGDKGAQGQNGLKGFKGNRGRIGPNGDPGSDGECHKTCPVIYPKRKSPRRTDIKTKEGTRSTPLETLCTINFKNKPNVWINPDNPFNVTCDEQGRTCIYPTKDTVDIIENNAFNYNHINKPFWLSSYNYNRKRFKLENFYKQMTLDQIEFLRTSSEVIQVIRYHCKNSYVLNNADTELHLLTWNDVIIGPKPSEWNPTHYVVNSEKACGKESPNNTWDYVDLTITGNSKRLPITDFYIRDIREEDQTFYVEHLSLCFI